MINNNISVGIDIVNVKRIESILSRKKESFLNKVFTEKEIEYISKNGDKATTVAGLFAAKEAISKALGSGIGKLAWKDMEITHDKKGKPIVNKENMEISITHEEDYALGFAIYYKDRIHIDLAIGERFKKILPPREKNSHKGDYGRVGIIGGSLGMTGAPYLAAQSALRTGSGLVYTIVPKSLGTIMSIKLTEAIIRPVEDRGKGYFTNESLNEILMNIDKLDVIGLGPGIGVDEERVFLVGEIIKNYKGPIVLDADGINCISNNKDLLYNRDEPIVITPHPGELARFLDKSTRDIQENRIYYSKYVSGKYNIVVVLKGFNTIVASPNGDVYVNSTGNPGMATAGSGDVLTGMIASFIGQRLRPIEASQLAVFCHGLAGDLACGQKGEYGLIATDILDNIPQSINKILG